LAAAIYCFCSCFSRNAKVGNPTHALRICKTARGFAADNRPNGPRTCQKLRFGRAAISGNCYGDQRRKKCPQCAAYCGQSFCGDVRDRRTRPTQLQDASNCQANNGESAHQHKDRCQMTFAKESGFAHSGTEPSGSASGSLLRLQLCAGQRRYPRSVLRNEVRNHHDELVGLLLRAGNQCVNAFLLPDLVIVIDVGLREFLREPTGRPVSPGLQGRCFGRREWGSGVSGHRTLGRSGHNQVAAFQHAVCIALRAIAVKGVSELEKSPAGVSDQLNATVRIWFLPPSSQSRWPRTIRIRQDASVTTAKPAIAIARDQVIDRVANHPWDEVEDPCPLPVRKLARNS
jgi:hypothetical protein